MFDGVVWGLDVSSTRVGLCVGRVGCVPTFESFSAAGTDDQPEDRFKRAMRWAVDRTAIDKPDFAYIEAPLDLMVGKTNPATSLLLKGMYAVVGATIALRGASVRPAKVQTVRKFLLGHGNLRKDIAEPLIRQRLREWGWTPKNHDEADAGAVWAYGVHLLRPDLMPKPLPFQIKKEAA